MKAPLPAEPAPPFVASDSIVRTIWGDADTILLIFAGAAAEFALNLAVDWLFFTGALPRDPGGRLFTTAKPAQYQRARDLDRGLCADVSPSIDDSQIDTRVISRHHQCHVP